MNHGRWVVECPVCNGGEFATGDVVRCGVPGCGTDIEVVLPPPNIRVQAEIVLRERETLHRNWYPDRESVADLKAENALHGVRF